MNLATAIRWRLSWNLVLQFYLLVQQSARTLQAYENTGYSAVRSLRTEIEKIVSMSSEEEADLFGQATLGQMMNKWKNSRLVELGADCGRPSHKVIDIDYERTKLSPSADPSIRKDRESAKKTGKISTFGALRRLRHQSKGSATRVISG
ncbi:hypothetical protein M407DRAFT_34849 [Tulasnella calospora MUT 4182]|uniref:Uncharacterized protein n=1 Tax=Tulasnella calospora MUT 4182 TaxID=1051891 RepID=A0A0C3L1D7_9AGAM|nr:hypothetical protein M407DRAFT_34849 [Tulasnella calospora MUT 4182]